MVKASVISHLLRVSSCRWWGGMRMCGFAGRVGPRAVRVLDEGGLGALRHRGPDAQRTERCTREDVAADFAFARLASVDLSDAGQQPMSSEAGRLPMGFDAEIYNHPALQHHVDR